MTGRVSTLVACAAVLVSSGLWVGGLLGTAAVALGAGGAALAAWVHQEPTRRKVPWIVASGALGILLGSMALLSGAVGLALFAAAAGAAQLLTGTQLSLFADPLPEGVELPDPLSLRTNLAAAADEGMRFVWNATALVSPPPGVARIVDDLRAAAARHREEGILDDPSLAHPPPPALEKVQLARLQIRGHGEAEHLRFESEFVPRDPEILDAWQGRVRNRTAHAYLWRHADGPRPTLICLHGYGMGRIDWDLWQWDLATWHRELGLDVVFPVLPLHGPRARGRRSGEGFLDGHPLETNAAFGQTIWELRRLSGWLRQQGAPAIGVHGLSLGGYTTALFASVERGLACAVPAIPVVSFPDLLAADRSPREQALRERHGLPDTLLREVFAPHAPLGHRPRVPHEGRLIVGARADRICPPTHAHALWEHWERPAIVWTPGSHLVPIGRQATRARVAEHLASTLLAASGSRLTKFRPLAETADHAPA